LQIAIDLLQRWRVERFDALHLENEKARLRAGLFL